MSNNQLMEIKRHTVDAVTTTIQNLEKAGQIKFPANYEPQNALRAAWLILQETMDKSNKPVLQACSRESIMYSLFDMVVQGLNPAKQQCYFIAYGQKLTCQRSYHGTKAVAMMVDDSIGDIVAEPVWEGDEFEYEIDRGQKRVIKHKQTLDSIDSKKPKGAYCLILDRQGDVKKTEIMTYKQIQEAWKKSQMRPVQDNGEVKQNSTHYQFMDEMIRKTIINRACKPIINSSNDEYLYRAIQRNEQDLSEAKAEQEASEKANQDLIDVEPKIQPEPEPEPAPEGQQKPQAEEQFDEETGEVEQPAANEEQEPAMAEEPGF